MTMISYAQNYEDVMLRRVFGDQRTGVYIDVGAYHPVDCSITKHFYDRGWSGINVEAAPNSYARVRDGRPRDINLNVGVSNTTGSMAFYEFPPEFGGLNSLSKDEADAHRSKGFEYTERQVPVTTLTNICEQNGITEIDFLSVDVEGHERQVLEGMDWKRFRPKVILVEATKPTTTVTIHDKWEHLLLESGYVFATFDGLNRFYVRAEDAELAEQLKIPPNVFDDFTPYTYQSQINNLRKRVRDYEIMSLGLLIPAHSVKRYLAKKVRALLGMDS